MSRNLAFIVIAIAGVLAGTPASAQQRLHDQIMKEIGPTFGSVRRNLEANNTAQVVEDAAKLEGLFSETEAWWARLNTGDAVRYSRFARDAAAAMGRAASANDIDAARLAVPDIQKTCTACHFTHREQTGEGYTIIP